MRTIAAIVLLSVPLPACTSISPANLGRLETASRVCEVLQNAVEWVKLPTSTDNGSFIMVRKE